MKEAPIISQPATRKYRDNYDAVFGKKPRLESAAIEECPICHKEHEVKRATVNGRFFGGPSGDITIQSCPNLPTDTFIPMKDGRPLVLEENDDAGKI